ncbi:hypothetical protein [Collimonas fungivorans]|uniref:hypothetical protein n=1 Tax=Collimonas fungivorans TaxID=158899 RepID=UPI0011D26047|nr:hypothetical protein [Collimonas fungivorans]
MSLPTDLPMYRKHRATTSRQNRETVRYARAQWLPDGLERYFAHDARCDADQPGQAGDILGQPGIISLRSPLFGGQSIGGGAAVIFIVPAPSARRWQHAIIAKFRVASRQHTFATIIKRTGS